MKRNRSTSITLHPILPASDVGRWLENQPIRALSLEEALADFGQQLRQGTN
jgi:hypothetical protein